MPEVQTKFCKFLFVCFSVQSKKCTTGAEIISTWINYQTARATTERISLHINSCTIAKHQLNVVLHVITNKNNSINLTKNPPLISGCVSQIALCVWNWRNNFSNNKNKKKKTSEGKVNERVPKWIVMSLNVKCVGWDGMHLTVFNAKQIGQRLHHELLQWITQIRPLWNWI